MKYSLLLLTLCTLLILPFCTTTRKAAGDKKKTEPLLSYSADIAPILQDRCAPCHFPNGGKRKFLDTYAAVADNYDDILYRVQLPVDSSGFMPFKSKKAPLNDSLIQVLRLWKAQQMPN